MIETLTTLVIKTIIKAYYDCIYCISDKTGNIRRASERAGFRPSFIIVKWIIQEAGDTKL